MSYIRAGSNPEGLYAFSTDNDKGKAVVELIPGWRYKLANCNNETPMLVPQAVFDKAVKLWDNRGEDRVNYKGFSIREVYVFADDGSPVPKDFCPFESKREAGFLIRLSYKGKWMLLWKVTWAYVVHNVLSEFRWPKTKPPKKKAKKIGRKTA